MASILRQIVAGPRARHPEAGLDLCYVTDNIVATSGPSGTYPQRAYRNPLDQVVSFLDSKHGADWAIWEFRAEGTGYPDEAVYGRVRHYPWPDHHPPPFRLVPMIMASMRNWLHGGELEGAAPSADKGTGVTKAASGLDKRAEEKGKRVVVVHCKAGKGRSGTVSCSYLISEEGWTPEDALARFTERRMRPRFGAGVSIPSQLRWITYVDRWTKGGKKYLDRPIEIVEIHVWGLRNGVKVDVEGFVDEGKKIDIFHTFKKEERTVVEAGAPEGGGLSDMVWEMAGYSIKVDKAPDEADLADSANAKPSREGAESAPAEHHHKRAHTLKHKGTDLIQKASPASSINPKSKTTNTANTASSSASTKSSASTHAEPGGKAVILKPATPIIIPNSDVNISVELRNRTSKSMGLTMVSAVAHVWFNAFFEGAGPEQDGRPDANGVFAMEWDAMDGIKGSSRKGARALDRLAVVWRAVGEGDASPTGEEVVEPDEGQPVPQFQAADWKGANQENPHDQRDLGLRTQSPRSADVSKASSVRSAELAASKDADETNSLKGVRTSGPTGEELRAIEQAVDAKKDEEDNKTGQSVLETPDTASGTTTKTGDTEVV